ncbi:MAG: hydantoinase B/oxoprolinase family protein, partial [Planctomycetota bacterium]
MDLVRLDVFQHLFAAVAEEMGAALMRSSFSPNIRERRDFSCALFDGAGRMIGQASHLPVHLGSTPLSVAAAIERVAIGPGDAVVLNDPYAGGTHLPDLTLVSPVFLAGRSRPDFYCANRAHHADVGGGEPGSMAPAGDVHGEGLRIPPVRLVRGGRVDREILSLLLANMRVRSEREGDLLAQWSTNRIGAERLRALAREHGPAVVRRQARELMDWTERLVRELLAGLPDGVWRFQDELETGGAGGNAQLRLAITKRGRRIRFDFSGSDSAPGSARNAPRAVTVSAVLYVLRTLLPPFAPTNDGILRPVEVITRPGTLVDAAYPSPVAAGNVETSQRLVDLILGALAAALPARIPAASAGTMSNLAFGGGGNDPAGGPVFAYYETIAGGAGAGPERAGASAVHTHMTNTRNTPIEALETAYPVRVLACGVRRGSGGAGRHRGGEGIVKRLLFLAPCRVSWVAERQERGPGGLAGGGAGRPGGARVAARAG